MATSKVTINRNLKGKVVFHKTFLQINGPEPLSTVMEKNLKPITEGGGNPTTKIVKQPNNTNNLHLIESF